MKSHRKARRSFFSTTLLTFLYATAATANWARHVVASRSFPGLLLGVISLLWTSPRSCEASWITEAVQEVWPGTTGGGPVPTLAIDSEGTPHIAFPREDPDSTWIGYARKVAGAWEVESVVNPGTSFFSMSLAIDADRNPAIGIVSGGDDRVNLARRTAGTWTFEIADDVVPGTTRSAVGNPVALAFGAAGQPVISYSRGSGLLGREAKVATKSSGTWVSEVVYGNSSPFSAPFHTSVAVGSDGNPSVTFAWMSPTFFARKSAGTWSVENVTVGNAATLALDASDNPHIAFVGGTDLVYATKESGVWSFEVVDPDTVDPGTSLALDGSGNPHIAYHAEGEIRYASRSAGGWTLTTICVDGSDPWLAFDRGSYAPREFPRIALAGSDDLLGFAFPDPTGVGDAPFLPAGASVSAFPNPAVDGHLHVSYSMPSPGEFVLSVFDLTGRRVRTLAEGSALAGAARVAWDGRDDGGRAVASGAYFLRLESERATATERIMLIR